MSNRKPYIRPMEAGWWRKTPFYRFYMLREATSVAAVWFSILLIYLVSALKGGYERWLSFLDFLNNPAVLVINIVALLAALLHTKTWFELAPKAVNVSDECGKKLKGGLWIITIVCTVLILLLALC